MVDPFVQCLHPRPSLWGRGNGHRNLIDHAVYLILASIQSNSRCQMLHRVSRDATVGERVELWEGWHPWFRRSMASS